MKKSFLKAAFILFAANTAMAGDYQVGNLTIENPVARATPANAPVSAGYMKITNIGTADDQLIDVQSEFSERGELHDMTIEDDVMKMRVLEDGVKVPGGESVLLVPGGLHMMFLGLNEQLVEGEKRSVTLTFEKAGSVELEVDVKGLAAIRKKLDGAMEMKQHDGHDHSNGTK